MAGRGGGAGRSFLSNQAVVVVGGGGVDNYGSAGPGQLSDYYGTDTQYDQLGVRARADSLLGGGINSDDETCCRSALEGCEADSCPGWCLCETQLECTRPLCSVPRPLRCAGVMFLACSLIEACGLFGVSLAIAVQEWGKPQQPVNASLHYDDALTLLSSSSNGEGFFGGSFRGRR